MALAMSRPFKHPATGIYWLRKRVPEDLRAVLGKREEKYSLKTRDPVEAKRAHAKALAALETRWANLRAPIRKLDNSELHRISVTIQEHWLELGKLPNVDWDTKIGGDLWERKKAGGLSHKIAISIPKPGELPRYPRLCCVSHERDELESWCQEQAAEIISAKGWKVDEEDKLKIAKAVSVGAQRAALALERRAKGDFGPESPVTVAPHPSDAITVNKPRAQAGWAAERQPVQKTIYEYTRVLRDLAKFLDHDDASRLSSQDLVAWKTKMVEANMRPKTIRDAKLAPVRAILQWAVDNHHLPSNPAARVAIGLKAKTAGIYKGVRRQRSENDNHRRAC
jgi:hypothetical protein